MNITLWIIAWLVAVSALASGLSKLAMSREQLAAKGMGWVNDFSPAAVKGIGVLEVLAAIGLVVPALVGKAQVMVPVAAVGLALLMAGAITVHLRRHEPKVITSSVVLLLLAAVLAWARFGPQSFTS
jgi:hypothetical protein